MKFDPTKPVQTRGGRTARIICTDARGGWPIIALVESSEGREETSRNGEDGAYSNHPDHPQSHHDLVNVPEKRTLDLWINVNADSRTVVGYSSVWRANIDAQGDRVSCVHVIHEYTVGEGMP